LDQKADYKIEKVQVKVGDVFGEREIQSLCQI